MEKQAYMKPQMLMVSIHQSTIICVSTVSKVISGDTGITYGGGGNGTARARTVDIWGDEADDQE